MIYVYTSLGTVYIRKVSTIKPALIPQTMPVYMKTYMKPVHTQVTAALFESDTDPCAVSPVPRAGHRC